MVIAVCLLYSRRQSSRCGRPGSQEGSQVHASELVGDGSKLAHGAMGGGGGGSDRTESGGGSFEGDGRDITINSSGGGKLSGAIGSGDVKDDHSASGGSGQAGGDEFTLIHLKEGGVFPPRSGLMVMGSRSRKDKGEFDQARGNVHFSCTF